MGRELDERRNRGPWLAAGLIAVLLVVWIVWWQWDAIVGNGPGDGTAVVPAGTIDETVESGELPLPDETARAETHWTETLGQAPVWPEDFSSPDDCERVESDLVRVCDVLDNRDYVRDAAPSGGTCGLLSAMADELASRPPDISSELTSYETILHNVFHLFRVLGRERLDLVRRIQWEEQELAEPASMAVYRWLVSRESCARSGATRLSLPALYSYAGFVFNTMGGQAYLRRRSPRIEGLASFYALLVVDRAQQADHNPAGVDPRPEIQRTRALLAAEPLVFRDHYLLILDQMAERWKERSEAS